MARASLPRYPWWFGDRTVRVYPATHCVTFSGPESYRKRGRAVQVNCPGHVLLGSAPAPAPAPEYRPDLGGTAVFAFVVAGRGSFIRAIGLFAVAQR